MAARVLSRCVRTLNRGAVVFTRCDVSVAAPAASLSRDRVFSHLAAGHKPLLAQVSVCFPPGDRPAASDLRARAHCVRAL